MIKDKSIKSMYLTKIKLDVERVNDIKKIYRKSLYERK